MPDRVVEQAREQEVFSHEVTPTEQRVETAFLNHAGLSYHRVKKASDTSTKPCANSIKVTVEETEVYI